MELLPINPGCLGELTLLEFLSGFLDVGIILEISYAESKQKAIASTFRPPAIHISMRFKIQCQIFAP